jgi:hypothetical protein
MNARTLTAVLCLTTGFLQAGDPAPISQVKNSTRWRFGASYAPILGMKAEYSGFGNFRNPFPPSAIAAGNEYIYRDGSVRVDSSGNFGGETTFWSYTNASQYDPTAFGGQGAINFSSLGSDLNGGGQVSDDAISAATGFEFYGLYELGQLPAIRTLGSRSASWGLRLGLQYGRVQTENTAALSAGVSTITDSFSLNGSVPPGAPFNGTFLGPGTLLSDTPVRTLTSSSASITGRRELDVHLFIPQFGTYLEIPLARKLDLMLEGGGLLAIASGRYDFETTVSSPADGTQTSSGSNSGTRFMPGVYLGAGISYALTEQLSLQTSARYQYLKSFQISANGSDAKLNFDSAFVLSIGALYQF